MNSPTSKSNKLAKCCLDAVITLTMDSEKSYRDRIIHACWAVRRVTDEDSFTDMMSDQTLEFWRGCDNSRFNKHNNELTDEEIWSLGSNLASYIYYALQDITKADMGLIPRDDKPFDDNRPARNKSTEE